MATSSSNEHSAFRDLVTQLTSGAIDRRTFLAAAAALGVSSGIAYFAAHLATAAAQSATPAPSPIASPGASPTAVISNRPTFGTEGQTRGAGGVLRVIVWQAPTTAAPHSALSDKDYLAAAPVVEPILHYAPDGSLIANLVEAVPSVDDGTLAEDLTSATFTLLDGLLWSDGEPVTADDFRFTWQWITTESNGATSIGVWQNVKDVEIVDDRTAKVTFVKPTVSWFEPFSGNYNGSLYPAHVFNNDPTNKNEAFGLNPIGTGPFVMEKFTANDSASYAVNEHYREPAKPFFSRITLKGGGDAAGAARAVLQTGDMDYAWNVQVEPDVLEQMVGDGSRGHVYSAGGTTVESINFNFSDPRKVVDGEKSSKDSKHPIFSDKAVREALNMAVPRDLIASTLYSEGEKPTANLLAGLPRWESPNTSWTFDLDAANAALDAAGWTLDGNLRSKDGVGLAFNFYTSVTPVRQKTQAIVKENFSKLGADVDIQAVDAGIFFSAEPGNDQNFYHMFWDMDMWTNGPYSPMPFSYLNRWYAGKDGGNIAQKANGWGKDNTQRYQNPEYDALYVQLINSIDEDEALDLLIQMNDLLIGDVVEIPIVNRSVGTYALQNRIRNENLANGPSFVLPFWNIANWNLNDGYEPIEG